MLAQICNAYWRLNKPANEIYVQRFFHDYAQENKARSFAKQVYAYLIEGDNIGLDTELCLGNHAYVKEYRDKMTHINSPNISIFSLFATELRPLAIFVLKRVTEDFLKASEFIDIIVTEIAIYSKNTEFFN